jgi:isocitrate dehydrogenase (NAD+)
LATLVVLEGDQTGQELLLEALRVLDSSVTSLQLEYECYDLSLENRRATENRVVLDAAEALKRHRAGIKAATITPEDKNDVGSPNRILREAIGATVILRSGRKLPRVMPVGGIHAPISVVRMAVGDAYGAKEWRTEEDAGEFAWRTERIERRVCRHVAEYAFLHAEKTNATVFGGPKYTVSPIYEGMLKEEMDAAAARHSLVDYDPQLIDATYALLLSAAGDKPLVIPALNRDGDCLSDLVMQLFGSIAGAESLVIAFDPSTSSGQALTSSGQALTSSGQALTSSGSALTPSTVMAEAPHGTAPRLQGKNVANPLAMILAAAAALSYIKDARAADASRAIYNAAIATLQDGIATADLGGHASTTDFTDAVIARLSPSVSS